MFLRSDKKTYLKFTVLFIHPSRLPTRAIILKLCVSYLDVLDGCLVVAAFGVEEHILRFEKAEVEVVDRPHDCLDLGEHPQAQAGNAVLQEIQK